MKTKLFLITLFLSVLSYGQTIYVNSGATGSNDGSSWANAFTSLQSALPLATATRSIWVAAGTYTPHASDRKATFSMPNNALVYGGFNGTETALNQRDVKTNITVLSGDLQGDDNATLLDTEPTRQDNSYHVVSLRGNVKNIVVDGFTISGGNANGTENFNCSVPAINQYFDTRGGAVYANPYAANHHVTGAFKNCILEKNTGTSVAVYAPFTPCGVTNNSTDIDFETCIFRDNFSKNLPSILYSGSSGYAIYSRGSIINSVLYNNTSPNQSACIYLGTSTANGGNASGISVDVVNTTFAKNNGVNGNVIYMLRANGGRMKNVIVHDNGSTTPFNIAGAGAVVTNSIVEGGQQSGLNVDPLFKDTANNDFSLQPLSPAINAGNNADFPGTITKDLAGNDRIYDTTIDMGAYEASTICVMPTNVQVPSPDILSANVTWTGNAASLNYDVAYVLSGQPIASATVVNNITATNYTINNLLASTQYDVYVRANCAAGVTTNWSAVTTFTTLDGPIYVNHLATGANNGTSWANAFTDLQSALPLATATKEVWVAAGTYKPHASDRLVSFNLVTQTKLYGGFAGTETSLNQRDPKTNVTILSGDLQGNDNATLLETEPTRQDNAYHVLTIKGGDKQNIIVDGFTITGGNANGGLDTSGATSGQYNRNHGAGVQMAHLAQNKHTSATFRDIIFEKNTAVYASAYGTFFPISHTTYNSAVGFTQNMKFESIVVRDNYSANNSAMFLFVPAGYSRLGQGHLINSVFYNNTSGTYASCLVLGTTRVNGADSDFDVINCTFTKNTGNNGNVFFMQYAQNQGIRNNIIYGNGSATPVALSGHGTTATNSIIEGGQLAGTNSDPLFVDAVNNDFTLQNTSPAFDAGNNNYIPAGITKDLAGNDRITYGTVDMGAYELTGTCVTPTNVQVSNITDVTADVTWTSTHASVSNWEVAYVETGQPIGNGTTITGITATNYSMMNLNINTTYDVYVRSNCGGGLYSAWTAVQTFTTTGPLFVNQSASGANDGSSWVNAFTDLQSALPLANAARKIWVAAGTYKPHASDRKATFALLPNVKIYGGFAGTETALNQRNVQNNVTILSGDLSGNDNATLLDTEPTRQDNSYHILTVKGAGANIVVDGFTITGGNANGGTLTTGAGASQYYETRGAAVFSQTTGTGQILRAVIKDCILEKNTGTSVAVYSHFNSGGYTNQQSYVDFYSCTIRDNYSKDASALLYGGNKYYQLHNRGIITNSLFYNNVSANEASCVYASSSTFDPYNNQWTPGAASVNIANCTFAKNTGANHKVIRIANGDNTNTFLRNSIVYGNGSTTPYNFNGIYGGITAQNNLATDPLFVDMNANDFRLQTGSGAIDTGNNSYITSGVTLDLHRNPRIFNTTVDMGAFEHNPTLGVGTNEVLSNFSVHPNPATTIFTVTTEEAVRKVRVYNLHGQRMIETKETQVDISTLSSGVYLIEVTTEDYKVGIKRLVVR